MPWYQCLIEGKNFPGVMIRKKGRVGFYATRWIEASSPEEAEMAVLDALREEPTFQLRDAELGADAKVYFTEIIEVEGPGGVNRGASWFSMDS